jgi:hypothetical protein
MDYKHKIESLLYKLPHKLQAKYALACAEDVFKHVKDEDKADVRKCLDVTQLWLDDRASCSDIFESYNKASFVFSFSSCIASASTYYAASGCTHHSNSSRVSSAVTAAEFATLASGKQFEYYYGVLLRVIGPLSELDRSIYDMEEK